MTTLTQLLYRGRIKKTPASRTSKLKKCPFAKGLVLRVRIMNPKKPNSAMRHVVKIKLYKGRRAVCRLPGSGFGVSKFYRVLMRGGRANDLPCVGYSLVRGVYDCPSVVIKKRSRSFWGVYRPDFLIKYVRRKTRKKMAAMNKFVWRNGRRVRLKIASFGV